jgi:hypothetical protein
MLSIARAACAEINSTKKARNFASMNQLILTRQQLVAKATPSLFSANRFNYRGFLTSSTLFLL